MAYVKIQSTEPTAIQVPTWFVTDYMPKAIGGFVKVYLFLLATYSLEHPIDLKIVATELDMLYSEVIAALKYWDEKSVITFKAIEDDHFELSFHYTKPTNEVTLSQPTAPPQIKVPITSTRPNYSSQELNIYQTQNPSISMLFKIAEEYLGRLLSSTDQQVLFGLHDWLHMPLDLIEYLLEYCTSNNHTQIRYIEKVAISWVDEGILSIEDAKSKMISDTTYFKILNELGISSQRLTRVQKDFIDKWLKEYKLPIAIILEGCKRAVSQTKNPSLKYVNAILSTWSKEQVKTIEDIEKIDRAYQAKSTQTAYSSPKRSLPPKNERFTNILSHDWDFEKLEELEDEYNHNHLYGGKL